MNEYLEDIVNRIAEQITDLKDGGRSAKEQAYVNFLHTRYHITWLSRFQSYIAVMQSFSAKKYSVDKHISALLHVQMLCIGTGIEESLLRFHKQYELQMVRFFYVFIFCMISQERHYF